MKTVTFYLIKEAVFYSNFGYKFIYYSSAVTLYSFHQSFDPFLYLVFSKGFISVVLEELNYLFFFWRTLYYYI